VTLFAVTVSSVPPSTASPDVPLLVTRSVRMYQVPVLSVATVPLVLVPTSVTTPLELTFTVTTAEPAELRMLRTSTFVLGSEVNLR